jgi:hypothetical protein
LLWTYSVLLSLLRSGDGEWDARAALPWLGDEPGCGGCCCGGVCVWWFWLGWLDGDGNGWVLDVSSRVWPWAPLGAAGLMNLRV